MNNHHIDLSKEIICQFPNGGKVVVYNSIDRTANDFQRIFGTYRKKGKYSRSMGAFSFGIVYAL